MNKILLIEDDQPMSWLVTALLEKQYKIILMETPIEALKWLESGNRPQLIISDLRMPDMEGTMFLQYLKESGFYENLPVLIITSYNSLQMKQKCLTLGAAEFLEKPVCGLGKVKAGLALAYLTGSILFQFWFVQTRIRAMGGKIQKIT